CARGRRFDYW
nr:immunoglobulin heavy chain junction region [Mus musculus]